MPGPEPGHRESTTGRPCRSSHSQARPALTSEQEPPCHLEGARRVRLVGWNAKGVISRVSVRCPEQVPVERIQEFELHFKAQALVDGSVLQQAEVLIHPGRHSNVRDARRVPQLERPSIAVLFQVLIDERGRRTTAAVGRRRVVDSSVKEAVDPGIGSLAGVERVQLLPSIAIHAAADRGARFVVPYGLLPPRNSTGAAEGERLS